MDCHLYDTQINYLHIVYQCSVRMQLYWCLLGVSTGDLRLINDDMTVNPYLSYMGLSFTC